MIEKISALAIPAVICIAALLMLCGKKDYFSHFTSGARERSVLPIMRTLRT